LSFETALLPLGGAVPEDYVFEAAADGSEVKFSVKEDALVMK